MPADAGGCSDILRTSGGQRGRRPDRRRSRKKTTTDMKLDTFSDYARKGAMCVLGLGLAVTAALPLTSCEGIMEDLEECPQGLRLRFVYDYNMEFANAFPSQVDCLTVVFYDAGGNPVATRTNTDREQLGDEFWRMTVDLAPGTYNILAYGGMEDSKANFSFTSEPETTRMKDLGVRLGSNFLTAPTGTQLHPLFYGRLETAEVGEDDITYRDVTVKMMKDTNNIRILLQNLNGDSLSGDDFTINITDDNTLFDYMNDIVPQENITYWPWTKGQQSAGVLDDGREAMLAYAELSTSRLVAGHDARLTVTSNDNGRTIIDIPLVNYLLLLKSQEFDKMGAQEFLDRESRWAITFFLQGDGTWMDAYIKVNDWIVRINNTEF